MWRMPSWASARPTPAFTGAGAGFARYSTPAPRPWRVEIVAAAVGVELAEQPVLRDHLGQSAKARCRALLLDDEARVDRAGRVAQRDHQIVLPVVARQPGEAGHVPRFREGRLWCSIIATIGRRGRFLRCAERRGAGRTSPAPCSASRVTV
jgi:hypothetical protein